jgi:hypothetical protein
MGSSRNRKSKVPEIGFIGNCLVGANKDQEELKIILAFCFCEYLK